MGTSFSTESCGGEDTGSSSAATDNSTSNYLLSLRRLVLQEDQNHTSSEEHQKSFLMIIWQCSNLLSLNNTPISSSTDSIVNFEAHLMQTSPVQLEIIRRRCEWLDELLSTYFTALHKMNAALHQLFNSMSNTSDLYYMERVSNIVGLHGGSHNQTDALNFLYDILLCSDESDETTDSISAKDVIELCFQMASVSHYILQHDLDVPTIELIEAVNSFSEESMIQSMADSLLEYAKTSRDNDQHFGGSGTATAATTIPKGRVTKSEFAEWQRKVVPDLILSSLAKFFHLLIFTPDGGSSQQHTPLQPCPTVRDSKEITSAKLKKDKAIPTSSPVFGTNTMKSPSPQMFAFSSISLSKFGEQWYRIFAGETDGWTFQSLEHAIMGYEGPTVLVIQGHSKHDDNNKQSVTFGAYTASKWQKNKRDYFGTSDCFLYQLQPTLRVLKPLPKMGKRGGHYMYFHSTTNTTTSNPSRKDDLAVGLGFGGSVRQPRLFIDNHLEECTVTHHDTSFEEGYIGLSPPTDDPFLSQTFSSSIHIDALEIYAVGDEGTINRGFKAQYQHRDIADATLRNARTVDKAAFLDDMRNGVIETKAFAHRGQVDGRANGALKGDEDGKANGL